jgi:hypothetical protein
MIKIKHHIHFVYKSCAESYGNSFAELDTNSHTIWIFFGTRKWFFSGFFFRQSARFQADRWNNSCLFFDAFQGHKMQVYVLTASVVLIIWSTILVLTWTNIA